MNITRLDDICAEHHPVLESHMSCAWMILQLLLPSSGMAVSPTTSPPHPAPQVFIDERSLPGGDGFQGKSNNLSRNH